MKLTRCTTFLACLSAAFVLSIGACGDDGEEVTPDAGEDPPDAAQNDPDAAPVVCTPENFQEVVLMPKCGSSFCHDSNQPAGPGLDLVTTGVETRLINVNPRGIGCTNLVFVTPQDRNNSYLFEKVNPNPTCGNRMPSGGVLTEDEINCMADWIDSLQ